jgi:hypothetical protein
MSSTATATVNGMPASSLHLQHKEVWVILGDGHMSSMGDRQCF